MAQPLALNSSAFCLAAYGSGNKFTNVDVKNRWSQVNIECHSRGIIHIGNGGDGDSRLIKVMKNDSGLGALDRNEERPWFMVSKFKVQENIN